MREMSKPPEIVADEIIEMFKNVEVTVVFHVTSNPQKVSDKMMDISAKQCSVICVEKIIDALKSINPNYEENTYWHPIDYWKEILNIIKGK